jgi:hypothetical protein
MQDSAVEISGRKIVNSGQREQKREVSKQLRIVKVVEEIDARQSGEIIEDTSASRAGSSLRSIDRIARAPLSCARDVEALPARLRLWAECCHQVEASCSPARAITRARTGRLAAAARAAALRLVAR